VPTSAVLFPCANRGQLGNALPVARALAADGVRAHLLSLDALHDQGVAPALERESLPEGVSHAPLAVPALSPPFARRPFVSRLRAVVALAPELRRLAKDFDAVVIGMDGAFERILLQEMRARGGFTALILDGPILPAPRLRRDRGAAWSARRWLRFHARRLGLHASHRLGLEPYVPGLLAHTPLDRIYTMGRFTTRALTAHGLTTPLETHGIPRLAELGRSSDGAADRIEPRPGRVLYASTAFRWHDDPYLDRCQRRDLESLATALPAAGWEFHVRIHPREDRAGYRNLVGRPGVHVSPPDIALADEILAAQAVVTSISTAAVEALGLGRPVWIHLGAFPDEHSEHMLGACLPVTRTPDALLTELAKLREGQTPPVTLPDDVWAPTTPESGLLIAESIRRALSG
jgi:hypothetical protein